MSMTSCQRFPRTLQEANRFDLAGIGTGQGEFTVCLPSIIIYRAEHQVPVMRMNPRIVLAHRVGSMAQPAVVGWIGDHARRYGVEFIASAWRRYQFGCRSRAGGHGSSSARTHEAGIRVQGSVRADPADSAGDRYRQRSKVAGHCRAGRYAGEYAEGRDEVGEPSSLSVTGMSGSLAYRPDCRLSDVTYSKVGQVHSAPGFPDPGFPGTSPPNPEGCPCPLGSAGRRAGASFFACVAMHVLAGGRRVAKKGG